MSFFQNFSIFFAFISGVFCQDLANDCVFPDNINILRLSRLHHPCESNQNSNFAIETHENFYCIFYSSFEISVFGLQSKFEITIEGEMDYEMIGAEDFQIENKTMKFSAFTQDVTLMIKKTGPKMPLITSVIVQDGAITGEPIIEFCVCRGCGIRDQAVQLILGGTDAAPGSWPWNSALYYRSDPTTLRFRCGATIINQRTLITTATCVHTNRKQITAEKLLIAVNEINLYGTSSKKLPIESIIVHESYWGEETKGSRIKDDYNVALLMTKSDIPFSLRVTPVCLPTRANFDFNGKKGFVVGWGYDKNFQLSSNLKQLEVPMAPFMSKDCYYKNRQFFIGHSGKRNFCAGYDSGKGICSGDSGGGLFSEVDGKFQLLGLASSANCKCVKETQVCEVFNLGVYVNIPQFLQWIHNNMY